MFCNSNIIYNIKHNLQHQHVLQQELSSTIDEVEQLQTSQKAAQQSVIEGETSSCSNILLI
jgi:hypothetical protein